MPTQYFPHDPWRIVEDQPDVTRNAFKQSIFSLGNGYMGLRGEIEEGLTASDGFPGTYLYGIYEDEPVVNYWKRVGLADKSGLFVEAPRWLSLHVTLNGEPLNMAQGRVSGYRRVLDLRTGLLTREFQWTAPSGLSVDVRSERFVSIARDPIAALRFSIKPLNGTAEISVSTGIDATVRNPGAVRSGWREIENSAPTPSTGLLVAATTTTDVQVATAMSILVDVDGHRILPISQENTQRRCFKTFKGAVSAGSVWRLEKIIAVRTSRETQRDQVVPICQAVLADAVQAGFETLRKEQAAAWAEYWSTRSLEIEGDAASQQGVNFSLFSLRQVYSGRDRSLNFVPKAYSVAYGGHYFWDTEITVFPCYLLSDPETAKALLQFRYNTLDQARAKARTLGLPGALFPWYTIDGREDSRIWEIHLLQVHINAVIAWAVRRYVDFTADTRFLADFGLELLVEIARFWTGRVSAPRTPNGPYTIRSVVGPDEYHMAVHNNCFTNCMAAHALQAAVEAVDTVRRLYPDSFHDLCTRLSLDAQEAIHWQDIARNLYVPYDAALGIHKQDDAFLDLDPITRDQIPESEIPLQKHWPWDKILRTRILKQPDVVQLMNTLNDRFDLEQKRRNYAFYEPICMHDSSLSPAEHGILASELGLHDEAFRYYLNIARMDLDDYNFNTADGLHATNMCGTLRVITEGFGGVRLRNGMLYVNPRCPSAWKRFKFTLHFQGRQIEVSATPQGSQLRLLSGPPLSVLFGERTVHLCIGSPERA